MIDAGGSREAGDIRPAIIGPLGPGQLACLRSWRALGLNPIFLHVIEKAKPFFIRSLCDAYVPLEERLIETPGGAARVAEILREKSASSLTCVSYDDMERLEHWRSRLPDGLRLCIPTQDAMEGLRSKMRQIALAREVGLPVLPTVVVTNKQTSGDVGSVLPMVIRPDDERAVRPIFKARLIGSERELAEFVRSLTRHHGPIVGQPYVSGANLIVHGSRRKSGEVRHSAFIANRKHRGVGLTIERTSLSGPLEDGCAALARRLGIVGVYHVDFLLSGADREPWFLEMNGRLGGTTGKVAALGLDEPGELLAAHDVERLPNVYEDYREGVATNKWAVLKAMRDCAWGEWSTIDYPTASRASHLWDMTKGLMKWRDEIMAGGSARSSAAYYSQALPRWSWRPPLISRAKERP